MAKIINCECGYVVRGETDDQLVTAAQQHAKEVHGMEMTRDQVMAIAVAE